MKNLTSLLSLLIVLFVCCTKSEAHLLESIYCGKQNCYDVLGVDRDANKSTIAKTYRKLARQYHPDLHRDPEAKIKAEEQFKIVATAYEILKDDESRTDYDYMLDNPDAYYAHYYRYYRHRMAPKVDVRIVIFVTISIISIIQYFSAKQRYEFAIKYFMTVPKYRNRAMDIAKEENLLPNDKKSRKSKQEQKEEIERIIQKIIEEKMDIKGSYAKPTIFNILWIQLLISPYTITKNLIWYIKFCRKHFLSKDPDYTEEEKYYLIRTYLKVGVHEFELIEEEIREGYLEKKLWIREKFDAWKVIEDENRKVKLAENNKYKQYRRYIKKSGVPRMTFDDS